MKKNEVMNANATIKATPKTNTKALKGKALEEYRKQATANSLQGILKAERERNATAPTTAPKKRGRKAKNAPTITEENATPEKLSKIEKAIEEKRALSLKLAQAMKTAREEYAKAVDEYTTDKTPENENKMTNAESANEKARKEYEKNAKAVDELTAQKRVCLRYMGIITADNINDIAKAFSIQAIETAMQSGGNPESAEKASNERETLLTGGNFTIMNALFVGAVRDNMQAEKDCKIVFSDAKDIAQTACAFLVQYMGKSLNDSAENGEKDKNGKEITIGRACFRAINKVINDERQREYKRAYIEDENGGFVEVPFLWDIDSINDFNAVKRIIEKLKLSTNEKRVLRLRMQGKSRTDISFALSISDNAVKVYCNRIKEKARKVYGVTEKTVKTAEEMRKAENERRTKTENNADKKPFTIKTAVFESKTHAEKIASLRKMYINARQKGKSERAEKIARYAVKLEKENRKKQASEKAQKRIEKRIEKLLQYANAPTV